MAVSSRHQRALESLRERLLAQLGEQVHSIVLFGSVARGDAKPDSDIDVLVVTDAPYETREHIDQISYDVGLDNDVFAQVLLFTTAGFESEVRLRSYFSMDILREGIVLYDDGTFERVRHQVSNAVPGVP